MDIPLYRPGLFGTDYLNDLCGIIVLLQHIIWVCMFYFVFDFDKLVDVASEVLVGEALGCLIELGRILLDYLLVLS